MRVVLRWPWRIFLTLLPLGMILLAGPRLKSGVALEAAFPVPNYMTRNLTLTHNAYATAAEALFNASPSDGSTKIWRAEAAIYAGDDAKSIEMLFQEGLSAAPASVRGWTLLAERLSFDDPHQASIALRQALSLGSLEYTLIGRQARLAARLWEDLPAEAREIALRQVGRLWAEPGLRGELVPLFMTLEGVALARQAFANDPEEYNEVHDWVAAR